MVNTIETRLKLDLTQELDINSCVSLWSEFYRKTWVMFNNLHLEENVIWHNLMNTNLFTSHQVDSIINKVKSEHAKFKALTKSQLNTHKNKLDNINKFINKEDKLIAKLNKDIIKLKSAKNLDYPKISKLFNSIKKKQFVINQKSIKLRRLTKSILILQKRIDNNTFKLCFGSSTLLKQRPGNHTDKFRLNSNQKVYDNLSDWKKDWDLARNNILYSVGNKNKPQGNAEIQYYHDSKTLRLRVTDKTYLNRLEIISKQLNISVNDLDDNKIIKNGIYRMQARFIEINNVEFCAKNQAKLIHSINNKQPIAAKIMKKLTPNGQDVGFYLQLSFSEVVMQQVKLNLKPTTMGIDLNQKGLAYCIVKTDGNKLNVTHKDNNNKSYGFISWELENKSTEQREWLISNAITEALTIAQEYGIYSIAIENLDFSSTINNMNSGYKAKSIKNKRNKVIFNYNIMLTSFAKSKFQELIVRKSERLGMTVNLVNPNYSSIGGFAKYGLLNKLPVDIAASLWLARQSIFGKEFKTENNVSFKKKYQEEISFPYHKQPKQSNRLFVGELKWNEVSSALGKNRNHWYKNIMDYIQPTVVKPLFAQEINPFE